MKRKASKMDRNSALGFTLIELLIVVAIIAILAAIAVPNFLEAQARSKIARVKADMRSVATAIESYTVDHNRPPVGEWESNPTNAVLPPNLQNWDTRVNWIWGMMTTPVAYITAIPRDPFTEAAGRVNISGGRGANWRFEYQTTGPSFIGKSPPISATHAEARGNGIQWWLSSYGPSRRFGPVNGVGIWRLGVLVKLPTTATSIRYPDGYYDATNGTKSYGFFFRSNRGVEPAN